MIQSPDPQPVEVITTLAKMEHFGFSNEATMLSELNGTAQAHGGRVPLHGHAFAEWLHHAFPLDCPYPRLEDFAGAQGKSNEEIPDAVKEFQAVADLGSVSASAHDLALELGQELKLSGADASLGLNFRPMLDVSSFVQNVAEVAPADTQGQAVTPTRPLRGVPPSQIPPEL